MEQMREWWSNVHTDEGEAIVGNRHITRAWSQVANGERSGGIPTGAAFRIHVRLKPEGAPKRYASEANRRAWETRPIACRRYVAIGGSPEDIRGFAI